MVQMSSVSVVFCWLILGWSVRAVGQQEESPSVRTEVVDILYWRLNWQVLLLHSEVLLDLASAPLWVWEVWWKCSQWRTHWTLSYRQSDNFPWWFSHTSSHVSPHLRPPTSSYSHIMEPVALPFLKKSLLLQVVIWPLATDLPTVTLAPGKTWFLSFCIYLPFNPPGPGLIRWPRPLHSLPRPPECWDWASVPLQLA